MNPRQRPIQLWLLGSVAVFALVVANLAWLLPTLEEIETDAWLLHRAIALDIRNQLSGFLNRQERSLLDAADILNQRRGFHNEVLARLLKENPPLESLTLLDLTGQEIFKTYRLLLITSADLKDQSGSALFGFMREGKVYLSPVVVSGVSEPLITVAVPLRPESARLPARPAGGPDGQGFFALVADVNLKFLLDVVRNVNADEVGEVYIVDQEGFIIAHPNSSQVFGRTNVFERALVREVLEGKEADTRDESFSYQNEKGEEIFAVGLPFDFTGWAVVVENPKKLALASSQRILNVALVSFGLEVLLAVLFIWNYFALIKTAALFESERNQREAILASLSDGVIEYDSKLRVTLMNPRAEELLGGKFNAIKGFAVTPELANARPDLRGIVELMYPALAPYASAAKEIPGLAAKAMELNLSQPKMKFWVTLTQVQNREGEMIGFLKIIHDISREELIGRLKSEFVSIAAHQLRTPLSALKWTIRLLLDGDAGELTASQQEFLGKGYIINERMIKLVNDLLNAARIEEGRFGYDFSEVDLKALLGSIAESFASLAEARKVSLKFEKLPETLPKIYADPEKLNLALSNLLDNAIKYTSAGGSVTLRLKRKGDWAEISVAETGVGIPETDKRRVFSKFFRASNVIRMETSGTGLGLFIAQNIIRRHGGAIKFRENSRARVTRLTPTW